MWCKNLETSAVGLDGIQNADLCLLSEVMGTLGSEKSNSKLRCQIFGPHYPCTFTDPELSAPKSITEVFAVLKL